MAMSSLLNSFFGIGMATESVIVVDSYSRADLMIVGVFFVGWSDSFVMVWKQLLRSI